MRKVCACTHVGDEEGVAHRLKPNKSKNHKKKNRKKNLRKIKKKPKKQENIKWTHVFKEKPRPEIK